MTKSSSGFDLDAAKSDPARCFDSPDDVVDMPGLSNEEKLEILRQWEMDARLLSVAEEENMTGDQPNPLDRVLKAITALTGESPAASADGGASSSKLGV